MKRVKTYITITTLALTTQLTNVHADVRFANKEIEKDFSSIYEKYQSVRKLYSKLDSSEETYVIQYGKTNGQTEGKFKTDGNNLYITIKKDGSYSLQAIFVHEATHAVQFEQGKIGFARKGNSAWKAVNIDVWDEAEAFYAMLNVATSSDYHNDSDQTTTNLQQFKRKMEVSNYNKAVKWLHVVYSELSKDQQNNPATDSTTFNKTWAKKRGLEFYYKPYQI